MQSLKDLIFIFLTLIIASTPAFPQKTSVRAEVDAFEYKIGDHISVNLEATFPKDWNVLFPTMSDTIDSFELINFSKLDTFFIENSNDLKITRKLTLIQFDSGSYVIPPFEFVFDPGKKELGQFIPKKTNPIEIQVSTIAIDTTKGFIDIKNNLEPRFSIWEYKKEILIVLTSFVLLIILFFVISKLRNKNKVKSDSFEDFDPTIEPHVLALGSLKKLEEKSLWQNGKFKEYYTELTDILRIYIKRCFEIDTLEMTSDEIISNYRKNNVKLELVSNLNTIFKMADLVKFAKSKPLPNENDESLKLAFDFVNSTVSESDASMQKDLESKEGKNV